MVSFVSEFKQYRYIYCGCQWMRSLGTLAVRRNIIVCSYIVSVNVCQVVFPVDGVPTNHTDETPADNDAVMADENTPGENDSEAGDEDSEDDDDIQVTIGDIKTTYESVLMLLESYN